MSDAWNVWEPFSVDPDSAFILAQILAQLKEAIKTDPNQAIATLDQAITELYPYTPIYKAQFRVYELAVAGKLPPKDDPTKSQSITG
ncbi:MAG TPA: hypothetical protein VJ842_17210 [Pyrinomonadaceae bacterium]|nr:hypothetical protein [Pyrinomonadaceae bacterium]